MAVSRNLTAEVVPAKRVLTPEEEFEIAVCYVAGHPIKVISAAYNISRSGVHRVVTRLGIATERGKRRSGA